MKIRSFVAVVAVLISHSVFAHDDRVGDIFIGHPYARASVPGQTSGGAYVTLENKSGTADALVSAESPAAASVEIHTMSMDHDVMRMREIDAIDLPPGAIITMQPGKGFHLMMMGLKAPLKAGDKIPLTLRFKKAGKVQTTVLVEDGRAQSAAPAKDMHR